MKLNYKHIISMLLLILCINITYAQTDAKKDKIDALRAAFISKKVNFTTQETQSFWPLYNEMNDKLDAARKTFRLQYNSKTNYDFATDKEAEAYLAAELNLKQKEFEIYRDYYEKFKKILPVKKVADVRRAEDDFKKEIIKTIKEN
ncbi:MAG: hypothetical protein Q7W13_04325 [Bacteroidia bacterium]|nr:hypothetical protein [Bacteroidia bacterium]